MGHTIRDIATALGAVAEGTLDITVTHAAEPAMAGHDALAMAMTPTYAKGLSQGCARAALLWPGADWRALGVEAAIFVTRPRLALAEVTTLFDPGPQIAAGIHPTAVIEAGAVIGEGAAIGAFVVIGAGAEIGARARIASHVSIGEGANIGPDALIHAGVRICARVRIGARFIAQPGAVIGGDGFSFVTPEKSGIEEVRETLGQRTKLTAQSWQRIHSLGTVVIGDDVEVGANSCIDRGTIRDTTIGSGTKIDNHVQIGHNCIVGRDCLFCGHSALSGSVRVGDRVILGGKAGVGDNLRVGDDAILTGGSGVLTHVPAGRVVAGTPAVRFESHLESYKALRRLPRLFAKVAELQKLVSNRPDSD